MEISSSTYFQKNDIISVLWPNRHLLHTHYTYLFIWQTGAEAVTWFLSIVAQWTWIFTSTLWWADSFVCIPRGDTAGPHSGSNFSILRKLHTDFWRVALYSHQQDTRVFPANLYRFSPALVFMTVTSITEGVESQGSSLSPRFVYERFACMHEHVPHECLLDPVELGLQMLVRPHVGAGN